jgi:hypothetical protein
MKAIRDVYPDLEEEFGWGGPGDYRPLLESFGYEILLQVDDGDYQGDSRLILRDGGRYGLLIFGWGSCSGCDSLQACCSFKDIEELRDQLHKDIIWKDSREEMLQFVRVRDWETQYSWHADETKEFVEKALAMLASPE